MESLQPELDFKNEIPEELFEKLRLSQKDSLKVAFSYVKQDDNSKSAVISLPTGGGKTGVICLLSHYSPQKRVLVLCHRKAVKKQLEIQISKGFFEKLEIATKPPKLLRGDISDVSEVGIYVSTFQKLRAMNEEEMVALRAGIDLVIVDEGHSEPSPEWSKLTRGLESHKVVVTATPYRNDLFQFDVSHNYAYFYSFSEAVSSKDIEQPDFEMVKKDELGRVVREFLDKYKEAKCIVKCKEKSDVEEYFQLFNDQFKVLAIHDTFTNDDRVNVKADVPKDLNKSDVQIIIHQRKLDEGIDIPQAKLLVLTYTVGSGRELVQTVGRVVRKYNNTPSQVKEFEGCGNSKIWSNYIQFDEYLSNPAAAKKFFKALDLSSLLNSYMDSFPDVSYLGNNYARKLDLSSDALIDAIKIPLLSVVFKNKGDGFDFQGMVDTLSLRSIREGEYVKHLNLGSISLSGNIKGFVSISFNSSKFLEDMFFFEPKINIFIAKEFEGHVAIFDSKGRRFLKEENLKLGRSISISNLLSLAGETQKVRTKEMSAFSIGSNNKRPDSFSMKSSELERNAISQSNSAYAISTTKISNINEEEMVESSYYLGSLSGRVSDQKKSGLALLEFSEWLDGIYERLCEGNVTSSSLLKSYAIPVDEAPKSNASIVIFDLGKDVGMEVDGEIYDFPDELLYIEYKENCGALLPNADLLRFSIKYDADEKSVSIVFEADGVLILNGEPVRNSISEFLSDHVEKILYEDGLCYTGNHFYKHRLPTQDGFDPKESGLDDDFIGIPELTNENLKEKYEENVEEDEFDSSSIFYIIDQLKSVVDKDSTKRSLGPFYDYIPGLDLMLCTDMGTEQADFVLSSKSKLVFIHVKCGKTTSPQSAAGALFEVGSQAIKNLEHMISSSEDLKASNRGYMINPWPSKTAVKKLNERVRLLNGERFVNPENDSKLREEVYDQAWDEVMKRRSSPRIEKEIWIVSGNAFSKKDFFNELKKGEKGKPESLQAYQLVQSWYTSLAAEDVGIKFFVSK